MYDVVGINLGYIYAGMALSFDCITFLFVPTSFRDSEYPFRKASEGISKSFADRNEVVSKINNRLTVFLI